MEMNYYSEIKRELINNEVNNKVKDYSKNKYELETYLRVGKLLIDAQGGEERAKYGDGLIKEYAEKLTKELGKGYSTRTLKYMRRFYIFQKGQPVVAQLSWSHYLILLSLNDNNKINYYLNEIIKNNYSKRKLIERIKSNEYERLDEDTKLKIATKEDLTIADGIKHPIKIKNTYDTTDIKEVMLKKLILDNISEFMEELGNGFCFIKSEYKIKMGDSFNYIDLLLFNYEFNCFVVIELKVTELKKEHIGQISTYMNYIDSNVKKIYQDKTIGIIIAKKDNKYVMEYCSDPRIYRTTYILV